MTEWGFRGQELPPVTVSPDEQEAVSADPNSALQSTLRGLRGTGRGFVQAGDLATSGAGTFGIAERGIKARQQFREDAAKRAGTGVALAGAAVRGRQGQEVINRRALEEQQLDQYRGQFEGMSTAEVIRAEDADWSSEAFRRYVSERAAPDRAAAELMKTQEDIEGMQLRGRERKVLMDPDVAASREKSMRNKVAIDEATSASALEEATKATTYGGAIDALVKAGIDDDMQVHNLSLAMNGDGGDVVRTQVQELAGLRRSLGALNAAVSDGGLAFDMEKFNSVASAAMSELGDDGAMTVETRIKVARAKQKALEALEQHEMERKEREAVMSISPRADEAVRAMETAMDRKIKALNVVNDAISKRERNGETPPAGDNDVLEANKLKNEIIELQRAISGAATATPAQTKGTPPPAATVGDVVGEKDVDDATLFGSIQ